MHVRDLNISGYTLLHNFTFNDKCARWNLHNDDITIIVEVNNDLDGGLGTSISQFLYLIHYERNSQNSATLSWVYQTKLMQRPFPNPVGSHTNTSFPSCMAFTESSCSSLRVRQKEAVCNGILRQTFSHVWWPRKMSFSGCDTEGGAHWDLPPPSMTCWLCSTWSFLASESVRLIT